MKQTERKVDVKAISLDGIDTIAVWRVESKEPVMKASPSWLEDDHDIEALDKDVPEDFQFYNESGNVTPSEPQLELRGK